MRLELVGSGPMEPALRRRIESERLPVVEADGSLVGLVCFNRRRNVFCVDG